MPSRAVVRTVAIACVLLACAAAAVSAARRGPRPIEREFVPIELFGDTLAKYDAKRAYAWGDSVARSAAARGDRAREAAALLWIADRHSTYDQEHDKGLPYFARVLPVATALRDTFALVKVYGRRGFGAQLAGRTEEAFADYERSAALARKAGLVELEGFAHRGLGSLAKFAGQYERARKELDLAVRQLPEQSFEHLHTRLMLGEMCVRTGRPDEAEARFEEVHAEALKRKNRWMVAASLQDLGNVAFENGDMAEADRKWFQAAAHYDTLVARGRISGESRIGTRINRAYAMFDLGRRAEAQALLEQQLEESAKLQNPQTRISVLAEVGRQLRHTGKAEAAERTLRQVRAGARGWDSMLEESATIELAGLLRETGRLAEADDLVDSLLVPTRRAQMTTDNVAGALSERSAIRRARGRPNEALVAAREAERLTRTHRSRPSLFWLDAAVELGRAQRAAGQPDSAVATLARAARAWEGWRAQISNLEWRERAGSGLAELFTQYGLALLDPRRRVSEPRRAREAFDALQVFQGRTLEERMRGSGLAGVSMAHRVTADTLRARVLRPGEALVDLVATPETTFAFVVTRERIAARLLPGTGRLDRLFQDWRGAMLDGAADLVVARGLERLSGELVAPLAPLIADRSRVIVTGGGPIALWPFAALSLPGESSALGGTRDVATAPSATLFALLRSRAGGAAVPRLVAIGRTIDAQGRPLPGAEREIDMLGRAYANVTVRSNPGDRTVSSLLDGLSAFDALHFSAHTEATAGTPWRSGFLLGRGTGEDAYLRASRVARMRLKARLAVLSGCQSAGALALSGEGAIGLSSSFLCAGTTTVVATLWPVEDTTAERYMSTFYAALAAGRSAAAAARDAQEALRRRPETANPRAWAAFVVVGEPGTRLPLKPRVRA